MKRQLTVKSLLTEVGTLVGMYGGEFRIGETAPTAESVYCEALGDNGHTQDSLFERWVVLKGTDGVWRQRLIADYTSGVLRFRHSAGPPDQNFSHAAGDTLFLFDRAAPAIILQAIMPAVEANPHLATITALKTIDTKELNKEYIQNNISETPTYADPDVKLYNKDNLRSAIALTNVKSILEVQTDGETLPVDYWDWRYFGNGTLELNGLLVIDNSLLQTKLTIIYTTETGAGLTDISDWNMSVAHVEPRAKECLKYHCAARWMQSSLAARDEEGWNYAKKTETHFRNRAAELEPVLPAVMK